MYKMVQSGGRHDKEKTYWRPGYNSDPCNGPGTYNITMETNTSSGNPPMQYIMKS